MFDRSTCIKPRAERTLLATGQTSQQEGEIGGSQRLAMHDLSWGFVDLDKDNVDFIGTSG